MPRSGAEPIQLAATPAYRDTYRTKVVTDPFSVPIEQKLELLRAVAAEARKVAGVFSVDGLDRRSPRGPVLRLVRGERDRAARLPDLTRVHGDGRRGRPQGQVADLPAARGLRRLRGRRAGRHARPGTPGRRRGGRAPEGTVGLARRQGPRAPADPPGADDPRVDRPLDRARSGPRLRGQLRRHVVPDARQAGQVPRRLRDRQFQRRPHPAREPLDLRLRRRRRQDPPVPDHQGGDLRRLPDDPRPGPPDRPDRVDGLLLRRLVCLGAVPAHAQRLARAVATSR